jgi:hypothetical protein
MHSVLAVTTDPKQSALTTSPPRFSMRVHYFPVSHVYSVAHSTCGKPSTLRSELAMAFATTNLTLISLCGLLPTKYKETWPLPCAFNAQGFFYTALQGTGFLLHCASRHRIYYTLRFKAQDFFYTALQGTGFLLHCASRHRICCLSIGALQSTIINSMCPSSTYPQKSDSLLKHSTRTERPPPEGTARYHAKCNERDKNVCITIHTATN